MVWNRVEGNFQAGKICFVELRVLRPFVVKPGDARLAGWAAAPNSERNGQGVDKVSADPEWPMCVAQAAENAAKDHGKNDLRAVFTAADSFTGWPH